MKKKHWPLVASGLLAMILFHGSAMSAEVVVVETAPPPRLGVGAILGDPTAVGIKLGLGDHHAVQFAAGWGYIDAPVSRFTLMGDYLVHFVPFQPRLASAGILSPYVGVGGLLGFHGQPNVADFGPRVPIGLSFLIREAPLEIFAEVAPGVLIVPYVAPMVQGGIGARVYFD